MDSPEKRLHDAMFGKMLKEKQKELPVPTMQENIDWSSVIANAKSELDEVTNGKYHEDNDNAQYMYEAVMKAVYGEDYFKWLNQQY